MTLEPGQVRTKKLPDGTTLRVQLHGGSLQSGRGRGRGKSTKVTRKDYRIVDSGDREARWEIIAPDGRTVSIVAKKSEAGNVIASDIAEQVHLRNSRYV